MVEGAGSRAQCVALLTDTFPCLFLAHFSTLSLSCCGLPCVYFCQINYVNLHAQLEARREQAAAGKLRAGPKVSHLLRLFLSIVGIPLSLCICICVCICAVSNWCVNVCVTPRFEDLLQLPKFFEISDRILYI